MAAKVRVKPSHAWRDGEVEMGDLPRPRAVVTEAAGGSKQTERAPMSFRNEQSKVQSELHTERQTLLRAKKTRLREMVETERTAAYNTQHELHGMRDGRLAPGNMPVNDITTGAAALEIVDEFMRGPLMDKFG
ncbi:unnamed protein product [Hyaloperonospora brassicae]|uniref:Uncharacterized protein n=1 Tax=Hyaloperonospora brassicae TaxID=162125 RepID=A0AAV0TGQ3_HYABA|nr:unnamed protein product [Hyaloperonospora brassicae]